MTTDNFKYPEVIRNFPEYMEVYDEIEQSLKKDIDHLEMNSTLQALMERICTVYVMIRYRENTRWQFPGDQKEYNSNFLNLVKEFNKIVDTSQDVKIEKFKSDLIGVIQSNIQKHVDDPSIRKNIFEDIAADLDKKGIK